MATFNNSKQNNDKDNQISVNTRVYQFMNKDGFDPSTLTIGGWNDMCSFRINPTLESSKQTDGRIYDYEKFVSPSLTRDKVMMLLYKIKKQIIPAIEAGEDKTVGIQVGGDSLLVVGTGKKITGSIRPYLAIHKSLNPNSKKPEMSIFYEFKKDMTVDDYDHTTGSYTIDTNISVEFELFVDLLSSFIRTGSGFTAHSIRFANKFIEDRLFNTVNGIATKVGAPTGGSKSYGNRTNIFGNNNSSYTGDRGSDGGSEVEPMGDINDLNSMLND